MTIALKLTGRMLFKDVKIQILFNSSDSLATI